MPHLTSKGSMVYCSYYQAHVIPETGWFVVAALKSYEHLAFDRTVDVDRSIFEFFVTPDAEHTFLQVMHYLHERGYIDNLVKLPNRLLSDKL